jgi:hypothetical protein
MLEFLSSFEYLYNAFAGDFFRRGILYRDPVIFNGTVCNLPVFGLEQAGNGFQGGGLSRPVTPQKGDDLPFLYGKGYAFKDLYDIRIDHTDVV